MENSRAPVPSRGKWDSKAEFFLACLGYAVGLGNIWRFPYLCYVSGGGAFLIPYFIMLIFCGIPLLYMEMAVGQLTRLGPVHAIAKLCPLLKGTGVCMVALSFALCTYYNVIIAWALHYLFHSFGKELPWKGCDNAWNTVHCVPEMVDTFENKTEVHTNLYTNYSVELIFYRKSPSEEYFNNKVLQMSSGIDEMGNMRWDLVGCLLLAWVLCYACLFKGVKSIGKVVYVTATVPYLMLIILLVRSVSLPGSWNGILYFILPDWERLRDPSVWLLAATQNFNSIGIGFGSLIVFSSYNRRDNNIMHDTFAIAIINSLTSLLAGFVVFSALGNISYTLGVSVSEAVYSGPELVFVALPRLFTQLPLPNLWSILFFIMLVFLGIDSQFAMVEVVDTSIMDQFGEKFNKYKVPKEVVTLILCFLCFLLGLPHVTQGGLYTFTLLDTYAAWLALMFVAYFEVLAISWFYGANRLAKEIGLMSRIRPYYFFPLCWLFISPLIITNILGFNMRHISLASFSYVYPAWAKVVGYMITISILISIPIGMIMTCRKFKGTCKQKFMLSITPTFETPYSKQKVTSHRPPVVIPVWYSQLAASEQPQPHTNVATAEINPSVPPENSLTEIASPPNYDIALNMETRPFIGNS